MEARFCYKCLALDCTGENAACEDVRAFTVSHLRNFYHINSYLRPCPEKDDSVEWLTMMATDTPCPGSGSSPTCSAGRFQIKSYNGEGIPPLIVHGTVMGCANEILLHSIRNAKTKSQCDIIIRNGTATTNTYHRMTLEHCSESQTLCFDQDYCVNPEQSVVKPFVDSGRSLARFDYGLVIGIIAFIVVIMAAIIGASVCSFPVNKPSNLPKTSEDADLIRIGRVRSTSSSVNGRRVNESRNFEDSACA